MKEVKQQILDSCDLINSQIYKRRAKKAVKKLTAPQNTFVNIIFI